MKDLKVTGLYLTFSIFVVSGLLSLVFLIPPEIGKLIFGIVLGVGILVGFCFILFLLNGFIKYSTVKGGHTFLTDRENRYMK